MQAGKTRSWRSICPLQLRGVCYPWFRGSLRCGCWALLQARAAGSPGALVPSRLLCCAVDARAGASAGSLPTARRGPVEGLPATPASPNRTSAQCFVMAPAELTCVCRHKGPGQEGESFSCV